MTIYDMTSKRADIIARELQEALRALFNALELREKPARRDVLKKMLMHSRNVAFIYVRRFYDMTDGPDAGALRATFAHVLECIRIPGNAEPMEY